MINTSTQMSSSNGAYALAITLGILFLIMFIVSFIIIYAPEPNKSNSGYVVLILAIVGFGLAIWEGSKVKAASTPADKIGTFAKYAPEILEGAALL